MIRKLCNIEQLPAEGTMKAVQGGELDLCLAVKNGRPYAVQNQCPHQGAPLAAGFLQGDHIVCPYHGWRFRLTNGEPEVSGDPPLKTYELRTIGNEVLIRTS